MMVLIAVTAVDHDDVDGDDGDDDIDDADGHADVDSYDDWNGVICCRRCLLGTVP